MGGLTDGTVARRRPGRPCGYANEQDAHMTHARLISLLVLATAIGCSHAATPAAATSPTVIPISPYLDTVPSLEVTVDGEPQRFLLDTAGGITVATPEFAKDIGCTPWGRLTGHRMRGDRVDGARCDDVELEVSGVPLELPSVLVWDLSKLLPPDAPPLAGSMGLDAWQNHAVTLDLGAGKLVLETPASLADRVQNAVEVPARFSREIQGLALVPFIAVETPEGRLWMELDSGSDGALIVGRHAAPALGLDARTGGRQATTITLAGGIEINAEAKVDDLIIDGNIGAPILRQWVVTIDLANERLWIAPTPPDGGA